MNQINKKIFLKSSYNCPQCGKEVLAQNNNEEPESGLVIKSKLTFIDENGDIMCRCKKCHNIINLPLQIINFKLK